MSDTTAVVPCFNYGAYVGEAVDSLLAQDDPPRVIVVDDGSTDPATRAALDALTVEVLRRPNAGVVAARNTGIALAETPYVICLDADDRLAPGALGALRDALAVHPEAGYAYGHIEFFGDWHGAWRMPPYDALRLLDRHLIGPTALMRRAMLDDTGGYDPAFALFEDWELWLNALEHGWPGVLVDATVLEYRRHGPSKHGDDRRRYRELRAQLRAKHAALYARRPELAARSGLGRGERLALRWFWGPRPVPAVVESALYRARFTRASAR
jgi:glycosyltransferase involved in cell wall biosynthesis